MSQVLWPISKLPLSKKPISSSFSTVTSRSKPISSSFSTVTSRSKPYLFLGSEIKEKVVNFNIYDPTGNKEVVKNLKFQDQSQTLGNLFKESRTIGSSRGHLVLRNEEDSSVHLVDISDQLKPKIIPLPPLHIDKYEQHANVSVSSPVNGDVIVAVKFYGSRLSLYRVGDSEWTRIDVPCPSFEDSMVIYSERDERFSLNNYNRYYTGPIDFTPKSGLVTPVSGYLTFPLSNIEEFEKDFPSLKNFSIFKEFNKDLPYFSNIRINQERVESPSGESFIVCWCVACFNEKGEIVDFDSDYSKTYKIAVSKQDERKEIGTYTNDIGDLCIFIGPNEAFCVSANDYPGLKPNSVYFANYVSDFGVCDLSSQTILHFSENITPYPYFPLWWIPPTSTPILTS